MPWVQGTCKGLDFLARAACATEVEPHSVPYLLHLCLFFLPLDSILLDLPHHGLNFCSIHSIFACFIPTYFHVATLTTKNVSFPFGNRCFPKSNSFVSTSLLTYSLSLVLRTPETANLAQVGSISAPTKLSRRCSGRKHMFGNNVLGRLILGILFWKNCLGFLLENL